eukprot:TRINITY_DN207_c0_g2_i1.p1 TRINITY_DN207_c0_g2~~TRINITY_DN207_c0_g2_i1.p1  ORF type:complete len:210 (+),score=55.39 TRINITY_DN207_c0_g2_i1:65-694(+)
MAEERIKILVLGPQKSGKTCVANYLSNYQDTPTAHYKTTVGARILDFEPEGLQLPRASKITVELWDVSGNETFKACWPAVAHQAHGVIFVYNIENKSELGDLQRWHKKFCTPDGVGPGVSCVTRDDHCMVFAHRSSQPQGNLKPQKPKLPDRLGRLKYIATSLDYPSDGDWKKEFERLVERIVLHKREQEEQAILDSRMDGTVPIREGH